MYTNSMIIKFINDGGVNVEVPDGHEFSSKYNTRIDSEKQFRRIHAYLIKLGYIRGNVVDAGAWIGDNSIPWAKMIRGKIYAIDPSEENCEYIKMLSDINGVNNVVVMCKGLCDRNVIISSNQSLRHTSFSVGDGCVNRVMAVSLDELHNSGDVVDIDCVHLDVEGMEWLVIRGGENMIKKYMPIISFEQHLNGDDYIGLSRYVMSMEYDVYMIDEVLNGCNIDCRNFLALPKKYGGLNLDIERHIGICGILKCVL